MLYQWNIVGHTQQLLSLEKEIKGRNFSHAYLFSGPHQGGKSSIAKTLASIIQCPNHYCKKCRDCQLIQTKAHPDTIFMEDNGESIKIDEVREIIRKTNLTSQSPYRVIVIENIERMPVEAQNSFLKTLEEPPGKTIFLLTTSHLDQVLLTIQSRVRHFHFSTVDDGILKAYLKETFGSRPEMDEIVNMAQGRPGLAISMIKDENAFAGQKKLYGQIEAFLKKNDLAQKFLFIEEIEKDKTQVDLFLDAFTRYVRKLLFEHMNSSSPLLGKRFTLRDIVNLFESLGKTRYFINRNVNKKLALENLMIQTER
ncbi:DNA polymerase III subunit delta' [Candidatus Peregrinibacteria bacterium]|nr:DNA polymerase III subunit delta' [Candidatus Peregrinibacteria bacterium]